MLKEELKKTTIAAIEVKSETVKDVYENRIEELETEKQQIEKELKNIPHQKLSSKSLGTTLKKG